MVRLFRQRNKILPEEANEVTEIIIATTASTRTGPLSRLGTMFRRIVIDDELWADLEEILIGADVGVRTTSALLDSVQIRVKEERLTSPKEVRETLRNEMVRILQKPIERGTLWGEAVVLPPSPHVILVAGVNGAGKTTSIAKLAHAYKTEGKSVILGAADTFRAAAIEQLQTWGNQMSVPVIAHEPGGDPGAVVYDTVSAAKARMTDVVIIDTAGRLQTKKNLMAELSKIRRVISGRQDGAPHEVLLVLDATTGQNGLNQARMFREATNVTAICLTKLDSTSKGGVVLAIANDLELPVRFVGTGESIEDIAPFDPQTYVAALFDDN